MGEDNRITPGETVVLYATGLGPKNGFVPDGDAPNAAIPAQATVVATLGGQPVQVFYAGTQPQYPGLDQINALLPINPVIGADGCAELSIRAGESTLRKFCILMKQ